MAQAQQSDGANQRPKVVPPKLKHFVEAKYPDTKRRPGDPPHPESAEVVLGLEISELGTVNDVQVVQSAGSAFDKAAAWAARGFVFEPATVDGKPVAVRIQYLYVFEVKEKIVTKEVEVTEPAEQPEPEPEEDLQDAFSATAQVDRPPREVTRRTIESEVLVRVPGTRGDALRAVELLPGVARPPFTAGALIVRGAAPQDSQTQLEGLPIPLIFHFGGLTSVIQPRLIKQIDFYPGNFASRFGRRTGGILDVELRDPRTDGFHGMADINIIDASFLLEGPIDEKGSFAVAARRSYVDLVLDAVIPEDNFSIVAAPVYWDYQGIFNYQLSDRDQVRMIGYGSSDTLRLLFNQPSDSDPIVFGNLSVATSFHKLQGSWIRRYSKDVTQRIDLSAGVLNLNFGLGDQLSFQLDSVEFLGRSEWQAKLSKRVRLIAGLDVRVQPTNVAFTGTQPTQSEGNPGSGIGAGEPASAQRLVSGTRSVTIHEPAGYLTFDLLPVENLQVLLGMRLDYFGWVDRWTFDPRSAVRYNLTDDTVIKAGVGMYSQPPQPQEGAAPVGNPNLLAIRSLHLSTGIEQKLLDRFELGAEVFYKYLWDRIVGTEGSLPPLFINDGLGRIYGLEIAARVNPGGDFFGFLSYTLSRSERQDRQDDWRLFDFDQTHILTVSGTYRLGRGWEAGATFRLVTGNPYTPIAGAIYNALADVYQPVYGEINSQRNPMFHRLDVRVEKQWTFTEWQLAVYLDVQNAYNNMNPEGILYNYDYSQSGIIAGLPIIPSLGVRGEF